MKMVDCVSVRNMRISDQKTIDRGTSGRELIRRAALGVYQAVDWSGKVAVVTGSGNNGADGFALASILHSKGIDVTVYKVSDHLHDDCAFFALEAENNGVAVESYRVGQQILHGYNMIVDCMLGTGFHGELRNIFRSAIEEINETASYVVSVDINSGMNGDTGQGSTIVRSDLTVAIEFVKTGMVCNKSKDYIGRLICIKIGIDLAEQEGKICNEREWVSLCKKLHVSPEESTVEYNGISFRKCPKWLDLSVYQLSCSDA